MSIEAMKQALEALDTCHWDYDSEEESYQTFDEDLVNDAFEALRQAIEVAEKDDMYKNPDTGNPCEGWDTSDMAHRSGGLSVEQAEKEPVKCTCGYGIGHPLVSKCTCTPRKEWVGLTDEEIKDILDCGRGGLVDIKKAEQILREKNT
jgi:hypothetical protein